MFSPMIFDAPRSEHSRPKLLSLLVVFFYPSVIFLVYMLFGARFYAFSSTAMLLISLVVTIAAFIILGYPKFILDGWRGISG